MATAPAAFAAATKAAPCVTAPGNAAYRSPGRTERESRLTPVAATSARPAGSLAPAVRASSATPTGTVRRGLMAATAPPAAVGVDTGPESTVPGPVTPT